jgi:hypothetical protein
MSDATITSLVPRATAIAAPRDCGVARIIELPAPRPTGRLIDPSVGTPMPRTRAERPFRRHDDDAGPLARALLAMGAGPA